MINTIIAVSFGIFMMISFFLGAIFGGAAMIYIKERKKDNVDD